MDDTNKGKNTRFEELTYGEKTEIYSDIASLGTFSTKDVYEKLILLSLVSLVYLKIKKQQPKTTALDILLKINKGEELTTYYIDMLESIALMVEELTYGCETSNSFGMTDSKDIINKIKEILSTWVPF